MAPLNFSSWGYRCIKHNVHGIEIKLWKSDKNSMYHYVEEHVDIISPNSLIHSRLRLTEKHYKVYKCDPSEQKQPFGCTLTNPPHVTPLRPDSTVIDGFSILIPQRIAVEISYLLVYCP